MVIIYIILQATAVALTNLGSATTTWASSNNIQAVSSNNTSVTVRTWQELFSFGGDDIEWNVIGTPLLIRRCGKNCVLVYPTNTSHGRIITIGIRTKNECGYSDWKYKYFTTYEITPDGGIGVMQLDILDYESSNLNILVYFCLQ